MNRKNVIFSDIIGIPLEVEICAIPGWDGFDKLIKFMKNKYSVEIIERYDGPDSRRWILKHKEHKFELRHEDPYGNSIVATNIESEQTVRKIGLDLEKRLKKL